MGQPQSNNVTWSNQIRKFSFENILGGPWGSHAKKFCTFSSRELFKIVLSMFLLILVLKELLVTEILSWQRRHPKKCTLELKSTIKGAIS